MITGMPSGRVLVLSLAFGMYTRRTGGGLHELRVACTCTATSARAWLVNATNPSTPAVRRPLLRCVTCRTLTSVFDQLRSMSFCRSLTLARFPSRTALKILPRSRRTRSSQPRQSTRSQGSPSNTTLGSSGPFTEVSNLSLSSSIRVHVHFKGPPAHVSTLNGLRAPGSISGQLAVDPSGGSSGLAVDGFLVPFGRRHSLLGHPVPPGVPPPLRSAYRSSCAYPRTFHGPIAGFPRSACVRPGPGRALSTPGTAVFAGHRVFRGRRLPPTNGRSLSPRYRFPARDADITRHHREFPGSRPSGPSPRLWPPWLGRRPLDFPVSFAPDRSRTGHARHGGDRSNTDL